MRAKLLGRSDRGRVQSRSSAGSGWVWSFLFQEVRAVTLGLSYVMSSHRPPHYYPDAQLELGKRSALRTPGVICVPEP